MAVSSEKIMYGHFFEDIKYRYPDIENFIWGEELIDCKIKLHKNKKDTIPEYNKIHNDIVAIGIITVNPREAGMLSVIQALQDTKRKKIYIKEELFNQFWRFLKISVLCGIENNPKECGQRNIDCPEDIIVLDLLKKGNNEPFLEDDVIKYKTIKEPKEDLKLKAMRQSKMGNPKFMYVYSKDGGPAHDKLCPHIVHISDESFCASETMPLGYEQCGKCRRLSIMRAGCENMQKQIPICNRFFVDNEVSLKQVENLVNAGIRFHTTDAKCLKVKGLEDSWEIRVSDTGNELWHNNYVKTGDTERYITEGFHNQNLEGRSVAGMLRYIQSYTWEKHLEHEEQKKPAQETAPVITEAPVDEKRNRLWAFFMRLTKLVSRDWRIKK